jgi:NADH-quinone oxidoreductase subunit N
MLYGFSGTTDLYAIAENVVAGGVPMIPLVASLLMVLVGFAFKISMFPFHFWAPDVYEGAPTPVTGFLSTASKAAGFSVLVRVMFVVFPEITAQWQQILAMLSVITMTLGNLVAMRQTNIKRMLAYSSIAHAGYVLIGVASATEFGLMGVVYYLVVYLLSNLAAFGFVVVYTNSTGKEDILDYAGLSRRNAGMAFGMVFILLSLGGIPPLGGFFGKVLLFAAAVKSGLVWLAVVGVLNSVIGLYYYLTVLKVVYLYRQEGDEIPLAMPPIQAVTLTALVVGVTLLGVVLAPMFNWATTAAAALF